MIKNEKGKIKNRIVNKSVLVRLKSYPLIICRNIKYAKPPRIIIAILFDCLTVKTFPQFLQFHLDLGNGCLNDIK